MIVSFFLSLICVMKNVIKLITCQVSEYVVVIFHKFVIVNRHFCIAFKGRRLNNKNRKNESQQCEGTQYVS